MRRRYLRGFVLIVAALMMACSLAACATLDAFVDTFIEQKEEPEETVRIGVFEPLTGPDSEYGKLEVMGIELANELYPVVLQKPVELIYADNQSDIDVATAAIQDLIAKRPAIVLGSYGDINSLVAVKYLEAAKIPAMAITNTNPLVTSNNPYYFRVCYVETYQGTALAKFTVESLGTSSAAIIREKGNDTATALARTFEDKMMQMTESPTTVCTTIEYEAGKADWSKEIASIKASGLQAVFLPANLDDTRAILNEADKQDYKGVFLGTDVWSSDEFLSIMNNLDVNVAISVVYAPDTSVNDMSKIFLQAYHAKYGVESVPDPAVALGFDAYIIAVDSINRICTALDGELLATSIGLETAFPGASGNITFDVDGNPMKTVIIEGVRNGKFVKLYTMEPIFE